MAEKNLVSYAGLSGVILIGETIDASVGGYADALKFSDCTDCSVVACTITGGAEDALDINRGTRFRFDRCRFNSGGRYAATVKGGASEITFEHCIFTAGREVDIDLGNWSDQAKPPAKTTGVRFINCFRDDGQPLRIRCLWADRPSIEATNATVSRVHPILLFFFALAKRLRF